MQSVLITMFVRVSGVWCSERFRGPPFRTVFLRSIGQTRKFLPYLCEREYARKIIHLLAHALPPTHSVNFHLNSLAFIGSLYPQTPPFTSPRPPLQ